MRRLHGLHRLAMLSAFMALFTVGCYSAPPEAIKHAADQVSANKRHATNADLGADAQLVGRVNEDQWHVQRKLLDSDYVIPAEAQARIDAAKAAAEARGE